MSRDVFFNGRKLTECDGDGSDELFAFDCPHCRKVVEFQKRSSAGYKCPLCSGLFAVDEETLNSRPIVDSVSLPDGVSLRD
jgi:hypothetical protein